MKLLNCAIWAWSQFVKCGGTISFRLTEFSRITSLAQYTAWQWTIAPIGALLQWTGGAICALGWILRWGKWPHVLWTCDECKLMHEFIPVKPKSNRWVPPLLFKGKVQVDED